MSQNNRSVSRRWPTSTLAWSCIGSLALGALLLYSAGFHWLGQWQTGEQALKRQALAICVQDFLLQPDRGQLQARLMETSSSYQRRQLIRDRKLAASFETAELCDDQIRNLDPARLEAPAEASVEPHKPA